MKLGEFTGSWAAATLMFAALGIGWWSVVAGFSLAMINAYQVQAFKRK